MTRNPNNPSLDGNFQFHGPQPFEFGAQELAGLKIFLTEPAIPPTASPAEEIAGKVGNCLACHAAPNFTDFKLHNTGIAQNEYDDPAIGAGHASWIVCMHSPFRLWPQEQPTTFPQRKTTPVQARGSDPSRQQGRR